MAALAQSLAELVVPFETLDIDGWRVPFTMARFGASSAVITSTDAVCTLPLLADTALTNKSELRGKIAVMQRGTCTFFDKVPAALVVTNVTSLRAILHSTALACANTPAAA